MNHARNLADRNGLRSRLPTPPGYPRHRDRGTLRRCAATSDSSPRCSGASSRRPRGRTCCATSSGCGARRSRCVVSPPTRAAGRPSASSRSSPASAPPRSRARSRRTSNSSTSLRSISASEPCANGDARPRTRSPPPSTRSANVTAPKPSTTSSTDSNSSPSSPRTRPRRRRRSVVENLWRIGALLEELDAARGRPDQSDDVERRLAEEVSALWRTDPLRRQTPEPLDEVRAAMALFDQTIFRELPHVIRELDRALGGDGTAAPRARPFIRWGSWVGADRDGNPNVTADVTRATAAVQSEHVLLGLEAATRRIARAVSVSQLDCPPSEQLLGVLDRDAALFPRARRGARPQAARRAASARARPRRAPPRRHSHRRRRPLRAPRRVRRRPPHGAGLPRRRRCHAPCLRRAPASPVAGRDASASTSPRSRSASTRRCTPPRSRRSGTTGRPRLRRGPRHLPRHRRRPTPSRPRGLPPVHRELHALGRGPAGRARTGGARRTRRGRDRRRAAVRIARRPRRGAEGPRRAPRRPRRRRARGRRRASPRGHARLLRLHEGRGHAGREPRPLPRAGGPRGVGGRPWHRAHAVPRPRRRARSRRRPGEPRDPRAGARLGRRPLQGDRTGRGGVRPLRQPAHRAAPPRAAHERRPAGLDAGARAARDRVLAALRSAGRTDGERVRASLARPDRTAGVRRVLPARDPDRGDRRAPARLEAGPAAPPAPDRSRTSARSRGSSRRASRA